MSSSTDAFSVAGRVAVVTGGYGVLGGDIASALAAAGAKVAILGRRRESLDEKTAEVQRAGGEAMSLVADVLDETLLRHARDELLAAGAMSIFSSTPRAAMSRARATTRRVFFRCH